MESERKSLSGLWGKLKTAGKTWVQRLIIAMQLFYENGLANHAGAGAYGFLLSIAPMLLLVSLLLLVAFRSSPQAIITLIRNIPFLEIVSDEHWLLEDFLAISRPGIAGVISALSIFWAVRIFAISLQRGLKIIFPGTKTRNPVTNSLITLAIEALALIFALVMILYSQTAIRLYEIFSFLPDISFLYVLAPLLNNKIFPIIALGLVSYCAYLLIPANPPRRLSALQGTVFCTCAYECTAFVLGIITRQSRYNFLYGALGSLIIQLINVYFFFLFFFFGAQLAFVIDSFEAFLFLRLRQARIKAKEKGYFNRLNVLYKLFFSVEGKLKKYFRFYQEGKTIFSKGDSGKEIYYLLEGNVEVNVSSTQNTDRITSVLEPGSFFGEMGYLLSENRNATIKAKTDVSALAIPPRLFDDILKYDTSLDRTVIEHLSRRLSDNNGVLSRLASKGDKSHLP